MLVQYFAHTLPHNWGSSFMIPATFKILLKTENPQITATYLTTPVQF